MVAEAGLEAASQILLCRKMCVYAPLLTECGEIVPNNPTFRHCLFFYKGKNKGKIPLWVFQCNPQCHPGSKRSTSLVKAVFQAHRQMFVLISDASCALATICTLIKRNLRLHLAVSSRRCFLFLGGCLRHW